MPADPVSLVAAYDAAIADFRELVGGIDADDWGRPGVNAPGPRLFPEDEDRPVGVIAHHVPAWLPRHTEMLRARAEGVERPPVDANAINAAEASELAGRSRAEALARLELEAPRSRAFIAGLDAEQLARRFTTRAGEMDLASAVERILIGHVSMHADSIRASLRGGRV